MTANCKEGKCCKPRALTFEGFMEIPPCTTRKHSTVDDTPVEPAKPAEASFPERHAVKPVAHAPARPALSTAAANRAFETIRLFLTSRNQTTTHRWRSLRMQPAEEEDAKRAIIRQYRGTTRNACITLVNPFSMREVKDGRAARNGCWSSMSF